jgi:hypothetical protein
MMYTTLKKNKWISCLGIASFFLLSFYPIHIKKNNSSKEGFAVVELFTSEGCSSCPPADAAVGRISQDKNVYLLSFHVDYWNALGWKDIYSSAAYSGRQQEYGNIFHLNSVYTPQIIVNGKTEFVGSDEGRLKETIKESLKQIPTAEIRLIVKQVDKNKIPVACSSTETGDFTLHIALVQHMATDFVQRGENKGKTLTHYGIVRDFQVVSNHQTGEISYLNLPADVKGTDCDIIAFLQNSKSGQIIAATRSSIP